MDSTTYHVWDKIKSLVTNGENIYHCTNNDDVRRINELANAGYITVSWKTDQDVAFCIAGETK